MRCGRVLPGCKTITCNCPFTPLDMAWSSLAANSQGFQAHSLTSPRCLQQPRACWEGMDPKHPARIKLQPNWCEILEVASHLRESLEYQLLCLLFIWHQDVHIPYNREALLVLKRTNKFSQHSSREQWWNSASDMRVTAPGNNGGTRPQT